MDPLQKEGKEGRVQDMEDELVAKSRAVEELRGELEEVRSAFEGVQQVIVSEGVQQVIVSEGVQQVIVKERWRRR